MKKVLMIIGGIVVGLIIIVVAIFAITSFSSKKLKCTSDEGEITIMYNDETLTGYTAKNITYDLNGQKEIAEQIGVEEYLDQFTDWFEENTSGTCKR